MGLVDLACLKCSHIAVIRHVTIVMVVSVALILAALGVNTHMAVGGTAMDTRPTFNMETFARVNWYPLIKDFHVKDNVVIVYTSIYPDDDGKNLGQTIADAIAQSNGKQMTVEVYGLNINPYLLATSKS